MAFTDTIRVDELNLADRISIKDALGEWVTGEVIALSLLGEDHEQHRITLELDDGYTVCFDRAPDVSVILEWADDKEITA